MKKLIFAVGLLFPALMYAQSFEGVIKFSMEYKGDQAEMIKSQAPSSTTVTLKGSNAKVIMEGGMMAAMMGDIIHKGDENITYFVQSSSKTVYKTKNEELKGSKNDDSEVKVTKENSTAVILGYKCQKYKVETKSGTNYVWATKDIDIGTTEFKGKISYKGVEGVVMKQEMNITDQGMTFTIILTMISYDKKTVNDSEFTFPSDYTVKEEVPAMVKMQMGN